MNNNDEPSPAEIVQRLEWVRKWSPLAADLVQTEMRREFGEDPTQPPLDLLTAHDILTTDWPEPVWAIPNLLPVGLTILAGRPKVGKSWLALQIALAVASGGYALGEPVEQGPVLYLALEDPPRRLEERMTKQGWTGDLSAEFMPLDKFQRQIADLRDGGGERLARQIELKEYRLVVIDTLSRAVSGDQNDVAEMTLALTPIQEMAHAYNCAVMLVDHHRKGTGAGPDAITDILGSTAKGAMADTAWGLYRESGKVGAKLVITGRDVEEQILALSWDGELGCWHCEGDADEAKITKNDQEILDALEVMGQSSLTDIANAVGKDRGNTYRRLSKLVNLEKVHKTGEQKDARYELASTE